MPSTGPYKKVLGLFKDECSGKQMTEFIEIRPKLYSYKVGEITPSEEASAHKKCKGVKKSVVQNQITHRDYKTCLLTKKEQMRKMNVIRSHNHELYTETINKIALSAEDDKRVIRKDSVHTYAIGHYAIPNIEHEKL